MRSHVAVYRAPPDANANAACQFARYAVHAPPPPPSIPQQQQQHHQQQQQQQQQQLWRNSAAPAAAATACYNLQAQLHHGLPYQQLQLVNQQRINECAGIPLISNACAHLTPAQRQRLLRKSASKAWPVSTTHNISQLAAHAQGQPLLQNGKHHQHHLQHQQQHLPQQQQQHHHLHQQHHPQQQQLQSPPQSWPAHASSYQPLRLNNFQLVDKSRVLRYQNSSPAALSSQEQQKGVSSNNHGNSSNSSSSGSSGTTQQDTTATTVADTCLPRIIKPRKRRKKDRKPANGVLLKLDTDALQPKLPQQQQQPSSSSSYTQLLSMSGGSNFGVGSSMQHDHSHGVCFCRDCDPLRSLWEYPLRRTHSDASSSNGGQANASGSGSGSCSTSSDNSCASSICSQSVANNNFEETEHFAPITGDSSRAEIVGVIGSQRAATTSTTTSATGITAATATAAAAATTSTTAAAALYLSDSSDSGYGDILSGMNIANDLFASCFSSHAGGGASIATAVGGTGATNASTNCSTSSAETLLNESINEISRKLIETCAVNEPCEPSSVFEMGLVATEGGGRGSSGGDSDSCSASACSDSGLDSAGSYSSEALVFNFEHLNLTDTNFVTPTAMDFLVDCNNNNCNSTTTSSSSSNSNDHKATSQQQQQFYNNCFDLVWRSSNHGGSDSSNAREMTAGKGGDSNATPTTKLVLGTVGKLKPAFSTIS